MSDFPSIKDIANPPAGSSATAPGPGDDTATKKFTRKIQQISWKQKEEEVAEEAARLGVPTIDLSAFPVSPDALRVIPLEVAEEQGVICFYYNPEEIRLGVFDFNEEVEKLVTEIGERHHATVTPYLISEHSLEQVLKSYTHLPIIKPVSKDIIITDEELNKYEVGIRNLDSLRSAFENVSTSDILTLIVASALKLNASDIHVEAEETTIAVRYRIDGIIHDAATLPKDQWKRFVARIKLLAALKINVTDHPQDGRVTLRLAEGSLDVRVSTLPTIYGESIVMRILHSGNKGVTFDELGLRGSVYAELKRQVERPNGMIITTGPTGSGKTTTMYSILRTLNKPGVKIITLEDPIEIKMDGVNQSQVDAAHNYTFAQGLRSILRQDPDICMVGEIRDLETAEISIQAALTGHLMLSTIHTNSASGTIPRFLSMGVKPFLLAPALNAVIGQRLVRRLCAHCTQEATLTPEYLARVKTVLGALPATEKQNINLNDLHFYEGKGCEVCSGLGYQGRVGIYEIFTMNKDIEQIIVSSEVSEYTIQSIAIKNGMVTVAQDGLLKALEKITSVEEVFRVTE